MTLLPSGDPWRGLYELEVVPAAHVVEGLVLGLGPGEIVVETVDLRPVHLGRPTQAKAAPSHQIDQVLNEATAGKRQENYRKIPFISQPRL